MCDSAAWAGRGGVHTKPSSSRWGRQEAGDRGKQQCSRLAPDERRRRSLTCGAAHAAAAWLRQRRPCAASCSPPRRPPQRPHRRLAPLPHDSRPALQTRTGLTRDSCVRRPDEAEKKLQDDGSRGSPQRRRQREGGQGEAPRVRCRSNPCSRCEMKPQVHRYSACRGFASDSVLLRQSDAEASC